MNTWLLIGVFIVGFVCGAGSALGGLFLLFRAFDTMYN